MSLHCQKSAKGDKVNTHKFKADIHQVKMTALDGFARARSAPMDREDTEAMAIEPPFFEKYKAILQSSANEKEKPSTVEGFEELELPLIDLSHLNLGPPERQECIEKMGQAAIEWGFFQIVNHGVPDDLLNRLKQEQIKVFQQPFDKKSENNFLNLSVQSYRWGNPLATSLRNLSWSEALHISLKDISKMDEYNKLRDRKIPKFVSFPNPIWSMLHIGLSNLILVPYILHVVAWYNVLMLPPTCQTRRRPYRWRYFDGTSDQMPSAMAPCRCLHHLISITVACLTQCAFEFASDRQHGLNFTLIRQHDPSTIEEYAEKANFLAQRLAEYLAQNLGIKANYFQENCSPSSSSLRMNRYPPCPYPSMMFGIIPHTDTDFLTIVSQDQVGGLQLKRNGRWVSVKPNPKALVVNIGDFYQALSNGVYKSITHRVIANQETERYSAAYFYCPTYETVIESCSKPSLYKKFSFKEYREQIQKDVKATGDKVGLSRFLL
ncbi:hypothetical protein CXB51_000506 [Gossypium anomalum]|uniref:Fe2OG dioxygenase domain-containing protein n=1 Tax=Gossypium anomalum TaxID=47600 RepID=A0A8J5Z9Y3_9ROSI|nr:hypothetical protein CXB51_000506 [Gossypium anomalum]